jgi:hypothetical protein
MVGLFLLELVWPCGAGAPARHLRFQSELLPSFMSVTNEHARQICFQNGISSRRAVFAGEGARATRVWQPFDFVQGKLWSLPA